MSPPQGHNLPLSEEKFEELEVEMEILTRIAASFEPGSAPGITVRRAAIALFFAMTHYSDTFEDFVTNFDQALTDEQKEKLKSLYQEQLGKLRELHQDTGLSLQAKLEKLQAMRKDITPELKKVLDPAQFEKWDKNMDRWLESLKQRLQAQGQE